MTLTSLSFYLLVLALLVLYYLVPKRFQWVVLLIGSYAFYAFVCLRYMGFIVVTTLTTYFGARGMDAMTAHMEQTVAAHKQDWEREERKAYKKRCKSRRKALMIAILLLNFGILAVLKYYNFFAESMETLFASVGLTVSLGHIGLLLPLGISFYTFQSMGYVLDVYREKVPAERNVGKLALFVSFFPQIIQGPIGVYDQLAHQLYDEHKYNFDNIRFGAQLILWGFFKKLVIADRAVGMIHTVAGAYTDYAGTYVLLAALVYALQLYADFSGGIDISRGVAQMFGITMGENFRRPYFSRTLTEYWHRWHISLGDWLRNYLFYPLSISKAFLNWGRHARQHLGNHIGKVLPTAVASLITFLIIGIWHGASWKYVAFGEHGHLADDDAAGLVDELLHRAQRLAGRDHIIDDDDALAVDQLRVRLVEHERLHALRRDGLDVYLEHAAHVGFGLFAGDEIFVRAALAGHFVHQRDGFRFGCDQVVIFGRQLEKLGCAVHGQLHVAEHDERADVQVVRDLAQGQIAL